MAGPSEVRFPGKQKQRIRARGTKKASGSVQKRLNKNLAELIEEPDRILPEIRYDARRSRKDPVLRTLKECDKVISKKHDKKWLRKRMKKSRGDQLACALAGSLHAAHDDEFSTVGVFKHPVYPSSSFVRRGNGKPSHLVSIQTHNNPILRLLAWEEHARQGWWFFSWGNNLVCTGKEGEAPLDWLVERLENSSLRLKAPKGKREGIWYTDGIDEATVEAGLPTKDGWIKLEFPCGVTVAIDSKTLEKNKDSFVQSIALSMLPPKIAGIADAELMWRPEGWPRDQSLPDVVKEKVDEVLEVWLGLSVDDARVNGVLRRTMCANFDEGIVVGEKWFAQEQHDEALAALSGSDLEREALALVMSEIDDGLAVRNDGSVLDLEDDVFRFEDNSLHPILVALWDDWGYHILEEMFAITGSAADNIVASQAKRKQGFGAFLKKMDSERTEATLLSRFPWSEGDMVGLCGQADSLIRRARIEGVGGTINAAKKGRGAGEKALGWAWINVHERAESEGWHFDSDSRDKGGDWVPTLTALWQASEALVDGNSKPKKSRATYVKAMKKFAESSGADDFSEP